MIRDSSHACYKSPIHKLVRFFEQSRDSWKEKYKAAKKDIKRLQNKERFLIKSKDTWKQAALKLRKEREAFQRQAQSLAHQIPAVKKKSRHSAPP